MPALTDYTASVLRTIVPLAWGTLVAWLLAKIPALAPLAETLAGLEEPLTVAVVGAFYAGMRKLEPRMPRWLRTIVFGSAAEPVYAPEAA